jgi:hypothetical protein
VIGAYGWADAGMRAIWVGAEGCGGARVEGAVGLICRDEYDRFHRLIG